MNRFKNGMDGFDGLDPPKMLKTRSSPDSESFEKPSTGRAWIGSPTGITWVECPLEMMISDDNDN